jgi:cytoskeletal protein RodZ
MAMSESEDQLEMGLTAGERLRAAREGLGLSIEDVATSTRIPTRHLSSLETGDFARLPAPTYSIGFAKSYAGAVGLNRAEIGDQLRAELGGSTRVHPNQAEQFEPMDPARAMPKWLIFVVIAAIIAVIAGATWLNNRAQTAPDNVVAAEEADPGLTVPAPAAAPATATPDASGPVLITATQQAWIQVKDGTTLLKEGVLEPGQSFAVPPGATAPVLTTAKAEGLRITVGSATAPAIGPAATKVSNVSLLGPALLKGPAAPTP